MSNANNVDMKTEQEVKTAIVTPTTRTINFFENVDHKTILDLSIDMNQKDDEISTPLDFRRDWSEDFDDVDTDNEGSRPVSTDLYAMLQKTIATIDPHELSDVDNDDASCDSLPEKIPSDIFNMHSDGNVQCQRNKLLKALYHDKSHNLVENGSLKRRRLN